MDQARTARRQRALQKLLVGLFRELFQTETSAVKHCRREAERLGEATPAVALREISRQAEGFLAELPRVAHAHGLPTSPGGAAVGALLSEARDNLLDRLVRSERSYRGTLIGLRHGVDLVVLLGQAARERGHAELSAFCDRWLGARVPLVASVERELVWFAKQPEDAVRPARGLLGPRRRSMQRAINA
ncbi:MAG TPA: hypothetical protein VJV78_16770 [Polyangiales bacterium]|nr:hypothetical protein [Polyangiales bacterium]